MKRILLMMGAVIVSLGVSAQISFWDNGRPEECVSLGVRAGIDISSINADDIFGIKSKTGFFGGVSADFRIINSFAVNTGVFFAQKGYKTQLVTATEQSMVDFHATANFIEVPVYASYRVSPDEDNSFQIFAGPYFDFGVYGKMKAKGHIAGTEIEPSVDLFKGDYGYRRFQVGIGVGGAYTYQHVTLSASYQWGITDVSRNSDAKWGNACITLGYNF